MNLCDFNKKLDEILDSHERASKSKQFLLLSFIYILTQDYHLQCGIIQKRTHNQIMFSTFECTDVFSKVSILMQNRGHQFHVGIFYI